MTSQDKPKNWLNIGYDVGHGKMKRPQFIPPEFIDVFFDRKIKRTYKRL